jgi:hypothetical protein
MSSRYELRDAHASRVLVEMYFGARCVTLEGTAAYDNGELRIEVQDPAGNFTLIMNDATWSGAILDSLDGNGFLIRLRHPAEG